MAAYLTCLLVISLYKGSKSLCASNVDLLPLLAPRRLVLMGRVVLAVLAVGALTLESPFVGEGLAVGVPDGVTDVPRAGVVASGGVVPVGGGMLVVGAAVLALAPVRVGRS